MKKTNQIPKVMNKDTILPNGKTVGQVEAEMRLAVEQIYRDNWAKGLSVPYRDENGILHLANPDGSDDLVEFNIDSKSFKLLSRYSEPGQGRFAYLLAS